MMKLKWPIKPKQPRLYIRGSEFQATLDDNIFEFVTPSKWNKL